MKFVVFVAVLLPAALALDQVQVFRQGELGYYCFRIPVLHLTSHGTLLAFAEGRGQRSKSCGDHGDVHIVLKRSTDYGATWSDLSTLYSESSHTIGNPAPVEDTASGKIVLLFSRDNKDIFQLESTDDGSTWEGLRDVSNMTKFSLDLAFVASGPSDGLQLPSGRLIICMYCFGKSFGSGPGSYAVYSDDNGGSWEKSQLTSDPTTGECKIVPLDLYSRPSANNTQLLMYSRTSTGVRALLHSADSGATWKNVTKPTSLNPQSSVQGSILAVTYVGVTDNTHLYVSQPRSKLREDMTVYHSTDGGLSWQVAYQLWAGPSGYSSMVKHHTAPRIYCLYERGEKSYTESLTFTSFPTLI